MAPEVSPRGTVDHIEFETPENIIVRYPLAGPGSRFAAWVEDMLILFVFALVAFVGSAVFGVMDLLGDYVVLGLLTLFAGIAPLLYFALFEYFRNGQTIGKRSNDIRVVSLGGFRLTVAAVLLRTIFRVIDSIPILWIVPLVTRRSQRLGDIVAGTVVIYEDRSGSVDAQVALLKERAERRFVFSAAQMGALSAEELDGVGKFLERRRSLTAEQKARLAERMAGAVVARMGCEPPAPGDDVLFLEDLYSTHLESQLRELS